MRKRFTYCYGSEKKTEKKNKENLLTKYWWQNQKMTEQIRFWNMTIKETINYFQ